MWEKALTVGSIAALLSVATSVKADSAHLTLTGVSPSLSESVQFNGGSPITTAVGTYNWDVDSTDVPSVIPGATLAAFCIEGTQSVSTGHSYTFNVLGPGAYSSVFSNSGLVSALFNQYYDTVLGAVGTTQKKQYNAAFQLAVWELVYDGTGDKPHGSDVNNSRWFTEGDFELAYSSGIGPGYDHHHHALADFSGAEINLAEGWLDHLDVHAAGAYDVYQLSNGTRQDQIFAVHGGATPTTSVPEPSAVLVLAVGLGALALRPRRAAI